MATPKSIPNAQAWEALERFGATYSDDHSIIGKLPTVVMPSAMQLARAFEASEYLRDRSVKWDGGYSGWCPHSIDDSVKLALSGWDAGTKDICSFDPSKLPLAFESPNVAWSVAGGFVDAGAYLAGEPDCMGMLDPVPQAEGVVKIWFNTFISASVPAKWIEDRAKRLARLVLGMVRADIPVEVIILDIARCHGETPNFCLEVPVYKPGWVLNMSQLAYWLGHPAAIRRLVYGANGALYNLTNYGIAQEQCNLLSAHAKKEGSIYIAEAYGTGYDLASAEAGWVAQAKRKLGGALV